MTDELPERRRGPIDPRVMGLSPALHRHLVVTSVLSVVVAAAVLLQAEAVARYLPELVDGHGWAARPLAGWLIVVAMARAAAAWATDRSSTAAVVATRRAVRSRLVDRVARVRADQRGELGPARASALTTTASDALEPWIRSYLPGLSLAVAVPLAAGLRILGADLISALILAVVVPLVPIFMILIGLASEAQAAKQWDALSRLAARFLDVLTGLPTLRLFGRADAQVDRVREVTDRYRQATLKTLRVAFLSALVLELLATLSVALVAVSLGGRLADGKVSLQTALLVLLLAPECILPIRRVSAAFHAATSGVDAATEIDAALELPVRPSGREPVPAAGALAASGVSLADPERAPARPPSTSPSGPGSWWR
ncbi:MAG: ABC transporter transmembrane domain-containing protein [Acidimicrobiales bacterium]